MWSKLVRLNALACTTSAFDKQLGEIRSTPELRAALVGAIEEGCAVGQAEGATDVDPAKALGELEQAHATLGSSMQRDIAAGREPELDAIPGSVLRAAARHGIAVPDDRTAGRADRRPRAAFPSPSIGALSGQPTQPKGNSSGETPGAPAGTACGGDRLDDLFLGLGLALVVLAVAEHPEVSRDAAVGVDRDAGQDLLALLQPEALEVEVREADAVGRVRRVLAIVCRHRLGEALEVLRDLPGRVRHLSGEGSASVIHWEAMSSAQPVDAPTMIRRSTRRIAAIAAR